MKNKILLCLAFLSFGSQVTCPETTAASSAEEIADQTMETVKIYYELIQRSIDFVEGRTEDRHALIKVCDAALALMPKGKEFAREVVHTEAGHEVLYNYEQQGEQQIKMFLFFLKSSLENEKTTNDQLREMIKQTVDAAIPQILGKAASRLHK